MNNFSRYRFKGTGLKFGLLIFLSLVILPNCSIPKEPKEPDKLEAGLQPVAPPQDRFLSTAEAEATERHDG